MENMWNLICKLSKNQRKVYDYYYVIHDGIKTKYVIIIFTVFVSPQIKTKYVIILRTYSYFTNNV